jgi:hypothetical protein
MGKDKSYWENKGVRRYVLDPEDVDELERESGVHEFINKKPREEAEDAAYGDYTKKHHMQGAAHHLTRMKAAQANGNYGDAKRHKILYDMHLKEMGVEAKDGKVPDEVTQHMQNPDAPQPMKFKAHKADTFFLNDKEAKPSEEAPVTKTELAKKILDMAKRLEAKHAEPVTLSKTLGDHAWTELIKAVVDDPDHHGQRPAFEIMHRPPQDMEDTVDHALPPEKQLQTPIGFTPKVPAIPGRRLANKEQDPDDHGNPKEIAQDRAEDKREEAAYRKEQTKRHGSDEPAYKAEKKPDYPHEPGEAEYDPRDDPWDDYATGENCSDCGEELHPNAKGNKCYDCRTTKKGEKPYMGRDEGIRRSKLPPGAPGSSKDGVGVQVDKKKAADKKAARGKVKPE